MTSFWGYLAGAGAVALVCRRDGVPLARIADLAAIPIGVALVFARLGCFMAGCDYGKVIVAAVGGAVSRGQPGVARPRARRARSPPSAPSRCRSIRPSSTRRCSAS